MYMKALILGLLTLFTKGEYQSEYKPIHTENDKVFSTHINYNVLPYQWDWINISGHSYVTKNLNQHIPQYCGSCWAHGDMSSLSDRVKIARKAKGPDINLPVQFILNGGVEQAGSCNGGDHYAAYDFLHDYVDIPFDTCLAYEACSSDATEKECHGRDYMCKPENICRTCSTFGVECTEINNYQNVTLFYPPSNTVVERASVLKRFDLFKTGMFEIPGFMPAFINSVMMVCATEVGDKTFFIAAILSMRHQPLLVFTGSLLALAAMTVLSAAMGFALPSLMPKKYTHYGAGLLFLYFGIKLLREGLSMQHGRSEEFEEAEEEIQDKKVGGGDRGEVVAAGPHDKAMTAVFWQALSLTFLAEWGDRSQIATIALAAAKNPIGVIAGGCVGHAMCTGLACVGGKMLANKISEKTVTIFGGGMFMLFALHSFIFDFYVSNI